MGVNFALILLLSSKPQDIVAFIVKPCGTDTETGHPMEFTIHISRLIETSSYWRRKLESTQRGSSSHPLRNSAKPTFFALFAHWLYTRSFSLDASLYLLPSQSFNALDYYRLYKMAKLYEIEELQTKALHQLTHGDTGKLDIIKILDATYRFSSNGSVLKTSLIEHVVRRKDALEVIEGLNNIESCRAICAAIWQRSSFNLAPPS